MDDLREHARRLRSAALEAVAEPLCMRADRRGPSWPLVSTFRQLRWRDRAQGRLRIVLGEPKE